VAAERNTTMYPDRYHWQGKGLVARRIKQRLAEKGDGEFENPAVLEGPVEINGQFMLPKRTCRPLDDEEGE
jgi:hypothetical protein